MHNIRTLFVVTFSAAQCNEINKSTSTSKILTSDEEVAS